mgnify:CR=1 FL=1
MIFDPVTIHKGCTVSDALQMMHDYHIGGIPVVDDERHLVGIVTNRDLRFETHLDKKVAEVMTSENLVTTHQQTDLKAAAAILQENKIEKLPVVDKDNHLVGLITYKDITKAKNKPMACKDAKGRLRVAAGVGVTADSLQRAEALVNAGVDAIVIPAKGSVSVNADAIKTSAGALHVLSVCKEKSINQAIRFLQQSGVKVYAASEKAAENYTHIAYDGPTAIVMGAEDTGVSYENLRICDAMIKIPQFGTIGSLNVSVTSSILIYEVVRQRMNKTNMNNHKNQTTMKKVIATTKAPAAIGPYNQAIQVGNMLVRFRPARFGSGHRHFPEGGVKSRPSSHSRT